MRSTTSSGRRRRSTSSRAARTSASTPWIPAGPWKDDRRVRLLLRSGRHGRGSRRARRLQPARSEAEDDALVRSVQAGLDSGVVPQGRLLLEQRAAARAFPPPRVRRASGLAAGWIKPCAQGVARLSGQDRAVLASPRAAKARRLGGSSRTTIGCSTDAQYLTVETTMWGGSYWKERRTMKTILVCYEERPLASRVVERTAFLGQGARRQGARHERCARTPWPWRPDRRRRLPCPVMRTRPRKRSLSSPHSA